MEETDRETEPGDGKGQTETDVGTADASAQIQSAPPTVVAEETAPAALEEMAPAESEAEPSRAEAPQPPVSERLGEAGEPVIEVSLRKLRSRSRRDFLLFGAGTLAAIAGFWWLLPDDTRGRHLTPRL